jgi:hypothetical protein
MPCRQCTVREQSVSMEWRCCVIWRFKILVVARTLLPLGAPDASSAPSRHTPLIPKFAWIVGVCRRAVSRESAARILLVIPTYGLSTRMFPLCASMTRTPTLEGCGVTLDGTS